MTHFSLMILTSSSGNIEKIMEPYDANKAVGPCIDVPREEYLEEMRGYYPGYSVLSDDEFIEKMKDEEDALFDDSGNLLTTHNPKGKWDWWVVGGRFNNLLKLKDGSRWYVAKVGEIDFSNDHEIYLEAKRFWELYIEGQEPINSQEEVTIVAYGSKEYYIKSYGTKENYADLESRFQTWAVITPDGKWHDNNIGIRQGFVLTTRLDDYATWIKNYYTNFIEGIDPELYAVIIDCHI